MNMREWDYECVLERQTERGIINQIWKWERGVSHGKSSPIIQNSVPHFLFIVVILQISVKCSLA